MKKNLVIFCIALFATFMNYSCGSSNTKDKSATDKEVVRVQYTCPMHPEVISDKPGDCPICGMTLVEKK